VSSWNDNGLRRFAWDNQKMFRTSYFPGLGWMLRKELWDELGPKWPKVRTNVLCLWMSSAYVGTVRCPGGTDVAPSLDADVGTVWHCHSQAHAVVATADGGVVCIGV
jgi:hypothetical protein